MARKTYTLEGLKVDFPNLVIQTFYKHEKSKINRLVLLCNHCHCIRDISLSNFISHKGPEHCHKCCRLFRPMEKGGSRTFEMVVKDGHAKFNYRFFYIQDHSRVFYKANTKDANFNIVCLKHKKVFSSTIAAHLRSPTGNCPDCAYETLGLTHRRSLDSILSQANEIHDNAYDYSLIKPEDHTNMNKKDKEYHSIICPIHGVFKQTFYVHIHDKCGCPTCGEELGFRHKDKAYTNATKKRHKISNLYVMEFSNHTETFFKIGISVDTEVRTKSLKVSSKQEYNIKSLLVLRADIDFIPKLEIVLHSVFQNFSYKPKQPFQGDGECFSTVHGILDHIPFDQVEIITNSLSQQEIAT